MPRVANISPRNLPGTFDGLVQLYPPRAVRDGVDYKNAQEVIDALTCIPKLTKGQAEYLDTLTILFEAYEDEHEAIGESGASPLDALRHLMEEHEMSASDLGRLLGERSLGSKILNEDRELSKTHIRKLADHFGVRADLFL